MPLLLYLSAYSLGEKRKPPDILHRGNLLRGKESHPLAKKRGHLTQYVGGTEPILRGVLSLQRG